MPEIFDNSGSFKKRDQEPEEERNFSRRDFLRMGAGVLGGAVLAGGIVEGVKYEEREAKDHEQQGIAEITEKINQPVSTTPVYSPGRVPFAGLISKAEQWAIRVRMGKAENTFSITKEGFERYNVGDKVPVVYDDRNNEIKSLKVPSTKDKK